MPYITAQDVDDYSRDSLERDERRLLDLGRRAVEMYAAAHIATTHMEVRAAGARVGGPEWHRRLGLVWVARAQLP